MNGYCEKNSKADVMFTARDAGGAARLAEAVRSRCSEVAQGRGCEVGDRGTVGDGASLWSAQADGMKVYAMEATKMTDRVRALVKANNVEDVVQVIEQSMEDVTLSKKVTVESSWELKFTGPCCPLCYVVSIINIHWGGRVGEVMHHQLQGGRVGGRRVRGSGCRWSSSVGGGSAESLLRGRLPVVSGKMDFGGSQQLVLA